MGMGVWSKSLCQCRSTARLHRAAGENAGGAFDVRIQWCSVCAPRTCVRERLCAWVRGYVWGGWGGDLNERVLPDGGRVPMVTVLLMGRSTFLLLLSRADLCV